MESDPVLGCIFDPLHQQMHHLDVMNHSPTRLRLNVVFHKALCWERFYFWRLAIVSSPNFLFFPMTLRCDERLIAVNIRISSNITEYVHEWTRRDLLQWKTATCVTSRWTFTSLEVIHYRKPQRRVTKMCRYRTI